MSAEGRTYGPKECGSCRLWRPILEDARGPIGPCRLEVRTGHFPGTAPTCERYLSRDAAIPLAPPPEPERRRARTLKPMVVVRRAGEEAPGPIPASTASSSRPVPAGARPSTAVHEGPLDSGRAAARPALEGEGAWPEELTDMTREEFAQALREALREETTPVRLAPRWEGGTVVLRPGDGQTQEKEIPLDSLFHKIVMIRDRLRVLEQKINANEKLSDAEKIDLQQYVTRCYGSLTTFNLLFRDEREKFVGEKT